MATGRKKFLIVTGVIIATFAVAVTAVALFFDINIYKPRIEAAASNATGMDIRINGRMRIALFPDFGVSIKDVDIKSRGKNLFRTDEMIVGLRLVPLVRREVQVVKFRLIKPEIYIEKDKGGKFNFEKPGQKSKPEQKLPAGRLDVEKFLISKGELIYVDKKSGGKTEAKGIDLNIKNLSFSGGGEDIIKNISFAGDMNVKEIKIKGIEISRLRLDIRCEKGKIEISPISMSTFGGTGKGSIKADMTGETPSFKIDYSLSKFRIERLIGAFSNKKTMEGEANFSSNLSFRGKGVDEIKRTINGKVSLRGERLTLSDLDLDNVLSKFEQSQNFNIVDAGAFFIAGPFGPALTKGYDFAGVYRASRGGEKGTIQKFVSDWKVKNGIADAEDVALSTRKNRIAMTGGLDFINNRFNDITVAALDEKGCARFKQKIHGNFNNPQVDKVSTMQSVVGSLFNLFRKTKKFVTGEKCEVFYTGSVEHPK